MYKLKYKAQKKFVFPKETFLNIYSLENMNKSWQPDVWVMAADITLSSLALAEKASEKKLH